MSLSLEGTRRGGGKDKRTAGPILPLAASTNILHKTKCKSTKLVVYTMKQFWLILLCDMRKSEMSHKAPLEKPSVTTH